MVSFQSVCSSAVWVGGIAKGSLPAIKGLLGGIAKGSLKATKEVGKKGLWIVSKFGGHDLTVGAWNEFSAKVKDVTKEDMHGRPMVIHDVPTTWEDTLGGASAKIVTGVTKAAAGAVLLTGTGCGALEYALNHTVNEDFKFENQFCNASQIVVQKLYEGTRDHVLPRLLDDGAKAIKGAANLAYKYPAGTAVSIPTAVLAGTAVWRMKVAFDSCAEAWNSNSIVDKAKGYGAGVINLGLAGAMGTAAVALNVWAGTISDPISMFSGSGANATAAASVS